MHTTRDFVAVYTGSFHDFSIIQLEAETAL